MIPDFQTLMRPVLQSAEAGERRINDVVDEMSDLFGLTEEERMELLPSGKQAKIANRVHWARSYLKQAGLVKATRRAHFEITDEGRSALKNAPERITTGYLERYPSYQEFRTRKKEVSNPDLIETQSRTEAGGQTPDEVLVSVYGELHQALAGDLLDRLREGSPTFFERTVVALLLAMGYGGSHGRGVVLGGAGDGGVDGVIDKDPLGVDQVYVQAKRYAEGATVGAGDIRNFFGALSLKDVSRGIFVTTAKFTTSATATAERLGARIVLIDGSRLAELMIRFQVGCRVKETFAVSVIDEEFFE